MKKNLQFVGVALLLLTLSCSGDKGDVGPAGLKGATGDAGAAGQNGPTGDKGAIGIVGQTGSAGPKGNQGTPGTYLNYSTGWKTLNWELDSDEMDGQKRVLTFSYDYEDPKITEKIVKDGVYEVYLFSAKQQESMKISRVETTYRQIGSKFYYTAFNVYPGGIEFIMTSDYATESTEEILKALRDDELKFSFSAIYNQ